MYDGSDSNTSAHAPFAQPPETRRTSHYPETHSIIHYLSTWSAKGGYARNLWLGAVTEQMPALNHSASPMSACYVEFELRGVWGWLTTHGGLKGVVLVLLAAAALVGVALGCPSAPLLGVLRPIFFGVGVFCASFSWVRYILQLQCRHHPDVLSCGLPNDHLSVAYAAWSTSSEPATFWWQRAAALMILVMNHLVRLEGVCGTSLWY